MLVPAAEESSQIRPPSVKVVIATPPYGQGEAICQKPPDGFDVGLQACVEEQQGKGEDMQAFSLLMGEV